jgi:hypothetical protein
MFGMFTRRSGKANMRHQKRHLPMSAAVTVRRDRKGYSVKIRNVDTSQSGDGVRLGVDATGVRIVGNSGEYESVSYSLSQRLNLWKKVAKLENAEQLTTFMSKWGAIGKLFDLGTYERSYDELKEVVDSVKILAKCVECGDAETFKHLIPGRTLSSLQIALDGYGLVNRVQTLFEFMIVEMWMALQLGSVNVCRCCEKPFLVGPPKTGLPRIDAQFCTPTCRNSAHRTRKRQKIANSRAASCGPHRTYG